MPNKEKMNEKIKDWNFLLEHLNQAKYKLYKYTRIFDKTVKENSKDDWNLLVPIEYRIFNNLKDIKVSRSHKSSIDIITFEDKDLGNNEIKALFCESVSKMLVEMFNSGSLTSLAYLKIGRNNGETVISAIY